MEILFESLLVDAVAQSLFYSIKGVVSCVFLVLVLWVSTGNAPLILHSLIYTVNSSSRYTRPTSTTFTTHAMFSGLQGEGVVCGVPVLPDSLCYYTAFYSGLLSFNRRAACEFRPVCTPHSALHVLNHLVSAGLHGCFLCCCWTCHSKKKKKKNHCSVQHVVL